MDRVREHGPRPQQPVRVVDVRVAGLLGEELRHEFDLCEILADVGLDAEGLVGCEFPQRGEGGGLAAGGEARGDDGGKEGGGGVEGVAVGDAGLGVGDGFGGAFVAVVRGAHVWVVHADAADVGALAALKGDVG